MKNKFSKQEYNQNHRYVDHLDGYQLEGERGRMEERKNMEATK